MIELDQFTHRLSGQANEILERDSMDSTGTMKEDRRLTIERKDIIVFCYKLRSWTHRKRIYQLISFQADGWHWKSRGVINMVRLSSQYDATKARIVMCQWKFTMHYSRSAHYNPQRQNLGGRNYVLFAFITDVDDDVSVGNDGIEHM